MRRDSAARFEEQYAAFRRQKAIYNTLFWGGFIVCVVAAGITAKFDVFTLIRGLPRTTEFLVKMVPPIHMSTFAADIGEWYWGIGKWLNSLLNTLLMAYLATVLGTIIGGALSFLAARNLAPNYLTYWVIRRSLEIARTVPGYRVGAAVRYGVRHRPNGWHSGYHGAYHRRSGKAVCRSEREHQYAARSTAFARPAATGSMKSASASFPRSCQIICLTHSGESN